MEQRHLRILCRGAGFFLSCFLFFSLLPIFLALFGGVPSGARKWAENCLVGGAGEYVRVGGGGGVCVRSWGIKAAGVQTVLKWRWGSVGRKMVVRVFFLLETLDGAF